MNKVKKISKVQSGFSILELLAVLAIAGVIVGGVLIGVGMVRDNNSIREQAEAIGTIYTNTTNLFSEDATDGLDLEQAINMGIFPKSLKVDTTSFTVTNQNNKGTVNLESEGDGFKLTWGGVKEGKVCLEIIKYQRKTGWDKIEGSVVAYNSISGDNTTFIKDATDACKEGTGTGGLITLEFTKGVN